MTEKPQSEVEWVFLKYDVQPNLFVCERCGDSFPIKTPCSAKMMIAVGDAFMKQHKHCKPRLGTPAAEPVQQDGSGSCCIVITPRGAQ
jgi:hypothetical protein